MHCYCRGMCGQLSSRDKPMNSWLPLGICNREQGTSTGNRNTSDHTGQAYLGDDDPLLSRRLRWVVPDGLMVPARAIVVIVLRTLHPIRLDHTYERCPETCLKFFPFGIVDLTA